MQLSNDAKVIKNYIQPQFDHYFWRNDLDENYLARCNKILRKLITNQS